MRARRPREQLEELSSPLFLRQAKEGSACVDEARENEFNCSFNGPARSSSRFEGKRDSSVLIPCRVTQVL